MNPLPRVVVGLPRRRKALLARMLVVTAVSVAAIGLGTATVSAREPTIHPAKVTVPDLKLSGKSG